MLLIAAASKMIFDAALKWVQPLFIRVVLPHCEAGFCQQAIGIIRISGCPETQIPDGASGYGSGSLLVMVLMIRSMPMRTKLYSIKAFPTSVA